MKVSRGGHSLMLRASDLSVVRLASVFKVGLITGYVLLFYTTVPR